MPQLVKGGKHVFGWSLVDQNGRMRIPDEAKEEYGFLPGERIFVLPGSRTSGGLIIARKPVISKTALSATIDSIPGLADFRTDEGCVVTAGRKICWTTIDGDGHLFLPTETLRIYGVRPGGKLLAVRGSYTGLSMLVKGPIFKEAERHPEIEVYRS
jgi:bifunctional DNA-binding transcriptional regulator/antitoxin component of YhaV-PrlF toxin-antitoxin module